MKIVVFITLLFLTGCASTSDRAGREFQRCDAYGHPSTEKGIGLCAQLTPREYARLMNI